MIYIFRIDSVGLIPAWTERLYVLSLLPLDVSFGWEKSFNVFESTQPSVTTLSWQSQFNWISDSFICWFPSFLIRPVYFFLHFLLEPIKSKRQGESNLPTAHNQYMAVCVLCFACPENAEKSNNDSRRGHTHTYTQPCGMWIWRTHASDTYS